MQSDVANSTFLEVERPLDSHVAWFCLRSQPKHEHIAAGHLRQFADVEVFNPRIRFTRSTRHGPAVVTESMFPSYLFARFDWTTGLSKVNYAPGVAEIVHFGNKWPTVPHEVIEDLQRAVGREELQVINNDLELGETVNVSGGLFHGLEAVITQVLPARQRVVVLMDFLGRQTTVELGMDCVIRGEGKK
jgi:transcriptional antiterminator RfaH